MKKLILTIRAVIFGEHVDLFAGDFNGTAWQCSNRNNIRTIEEAFADCALPTPPGPTPLWRPGSVPGCWTDVCGDSVSRPNPIGTGQYWLHLDIVRWQDVQPQRQKHDQRILLKEMSSPEPLRQGEWAYQRYYERPFAFVVTPRPFAHVRGSDLQQGFCVRLHQVTLPFSSSRCMCLAHSRREPSTLHA